METKIMSLQKYVSKLKAKHSEIDEEIRLEMARRLPDFSVISSLKKKKLKIKDMMQRVQSRVSLQELVITS